MRKSAWAARRLPEDAAGTRSERSNRRNIIALGTLVWSLATMACGFADSFAELFVARMGVGLPATMLAFVLSLIALRPYATLRRSLFGADQERATAPA